MSEQQTREVYGPTGAALVSFVLSFISAFAIRAGLIDMLGPNPLTTRGPTIVAIGVFLGEFGIMLAILGARDALLRRGPKRSV